VSGTCGYQWVDDDKLGVHVDGHAKAESAYAWLFENDADNRQYVAVLGPPVNSAQDARRAPISAARRVKGGLA